MSLDIGIWTLGLIVSIKFNKAPFFLLGDYIGLVRRFYSFFFFFFLHQEISFMKSTVSLISM
jgi:hypothetical protein